jgi:hypothetical protein
MIENSTAMDFLMLKEVSEMDETICEGAMEE